MNKFNESEQTISTRGEFELLQYIYINNSEIGRVYYDTYPYN